MPELYTFVTEQTNDFTNLSDIETTLSELDVAYDKHIEDGYAYLSGSNWEEDCGYPVELRMIFAGSGLRCVYCNNNEYGMIDGVNNCKLDNSTF